MRYHVFVATFAALIFSGCSGQGVGSLPQTAPRASGASSPRAPIAPALRAALACDGHTDVSAALQASIDALGSSGGTVRLPRGTCAIGTTVAVTQSNITLVGEGAGYAADRATHAATSLLWIGAVKGTLLRFGNREAPVQGGGIANIALLSNNGLAGYGLLLAGEEGGKFSNFTADAFSVAAVELGWTMFDQMHNRFNNYNLDNEQNRGASIVLGTPERSTAYYNEFDNGFIQTKDGVGIEMLKSDGNYFADTQEIMDRGGKGIGVLFGCGSTSNHFYWLTAGYSNPYNGVVVDGIGSCGYPKEAFADSIDLYDQNDNGGAHPLVGAGTAFLCTTDTGRSCPMHYGKLSRKHR